jgi:hypothetical protein
VVNTVSSSKAGAAKAVGLAIDEYEVFLHVAWPDEIYPLDWLALWVYPFPYELNQMSHTVGFVVRGLDLGTGKLV